jgi:predicted nucleic acid-binding protein
MNGIVLDSSVAASWCISDEANAKSDALLVRVRDHGAFVPALWYWEIANVLSMAERRGCAAASDVAISLELLSELPIEVDAACTTRAWRETMALARAHKLTAYGAAYLELALRLGCELATNDAALRAAAKAAGVGLA